MIPKMKRYFIIIIIYNNVSRKNDDAIYTGIATLHNKPDIFHHDDDCGSLRAVQKMSLLG